MNTNIIYQGDCLSTLKTLPDNSVDCCVTSPPYYGLRDYGISGQIGQEESPYEYIKNLTAVFSEVYRVLKPEATLWVNIGDSYAGSGRGKGDINKKGKSPKAAYANNGFTKPYKLHGIKNKDLIGTPWMLSFSLRDEGWYLRQDIIWSKPNCMPESVDDRFCKSHEYIFLFSKRPNYYFNGEAALEPALGFDGRKDTRYKGGGKDMAGGAHERWPRRGYAVKDGDTGISLQHHGGNILTRPMRLKRDVCAVSSEPSSEKHFAMFPQKLIAPCILCGCPENGIVLDPFMGSGTTAIVAKKLMRKYIGCEINPEYAKIAERRIAETNPLFDEAI
jgi:DNA modification methylase